MRAVLAAIVVLLIASAPASGAPIWPPKQVQQLSMHRIEVVAMHKQSRQQTVLTYHETFPDAETAAKMVGVVRGAFFEWLKANYDMNEAEFDEEFELTIRVVGVSGGATLRRAA